MEKHLKREQIECMPWSLAEESKFCISLMWQVKNMLVFILGILKVVYSFLNAQIIFLCLCLNIFIKKGNAYILTPDLAKLYYENYLTFRLPPFSTWLVIVIYSFAGFSWLLPTLKTNFELKCYAIFWFITLWSTKNLKKYDNLI